jgi:hypothetical protein
MLKPRLQILTPRTPTNMPICHLQEALHINKPDSKWGVCHLGLELVVDSLVGHGEAVQLQIEDHHQILGDMEQRNMEVEADMVRSDTKSQQPRDMEKADMVV